MFNIIFFLTLYDNYTIITYSKHIWSDCMIKFIVVDDDPAEIRHIRDLLSKIVAVENEVKTFSKLNSELKKEILNVDTRKVYILDIELNDKISGINIAKLIRDVDYESEILIITNHDNMFESTYKSVYEIFDFIIKFHDFDKHFQKVIKAILKRNFDNKMFTYKANNVELSIYYKTIQYIYTEDRKLVIVTSSNCYTVNLTMKEILSMLDSRFKQCYRSCIVNVERVCEKNYKDGYFTTDTGDKVYMLSKKYRKDLEL